MMTTPKSLMIQLAQIQEMKSNTILFKIVQPNSKVLVRTIRKEMLQIDPKSQLIRSGDNYKYVGKSYNTVVMQLKKLGLTLTSVDGE